ncbi:MAG: nuclear transport factor 2 family protein [Proteobacteria bacterium]|nr:nuclear transport factor 2 family protein [Pseudomonadota bacterium]
MPYRISPLRIMSKITLLFISLLLAFGLSACGAGMLQTKDFEQPYFFAIDEESNIKDNEENFEILQTVQKYRDAIANKDIATLKSLISKDYYENGSTTDDLSDDYGNERIEEILNDYLSQSVKDIRFVIEVKQLTKENMEYHVDYQYIWNFRYEVAGQNYWQSKNDTNRMTIIREDDAWKIKSGL